MATVESVAPDSRMPKLWPTGGTLFWQIKSNIPLYTLQFSNGVSEGSKLYHHVVHAPILFIGERAQLLLGSYRLIINMSFVGILKTKATHDKTCQQYKLLTNLPTSLLSSFIKACLLTSPLG